MFACNPLVLSFVISLTQGTTELFVSNELQKFRGSLQIFAKVLQNSVLTYSFKASS